jgi:hypothetical protein
MIVVAGERRLVTQRAGMAVHSSLVKELRAMVTFIRRARINGADKQREAMTWATETAEYVNGKYGFSEVRAGLEIYGHTGSVWWTGRLESLEAVAQAVMAAMADAGYQQRIVDGARLFVHATTEDTVLLDI